MRSRRELHKELEERGQVLSVARSPSFVPAVIGPLPVVEPAALEKRARPRRRSYASAIELEIDGVAVKIGRGADAGVITAVIEALRATR